MGRSKTTLFTPAQNELADLAKALAPVKQIDHSILLDELSILREKYLNGTPSDEHKFAAAVITAAMAVIIGIWNAIYAGKY